MGKRLEAVTKTVDTLKQYSLTEGVALCKKSATAKFNETIELHIRLGIDPKQSDQQVRGTVNLPHGSGKSKRVAVVCKGEKQKEAQAAGADPVGPEDLIERMQQGIMDFDVMVATPDVMKDIAKLGKVLGPRGLMPNPKSGTVTFDIGKTVKELKAGRVEYKCDDFGILHVGIGKAKFEEKQIAENVRAVLEQVIKAKPAASKGVYLRSVTLSSTMGPGIKLDPN
ncbi:MAG: 50S ribosomal protein L1, partial [Elusimicrobia bacterium]|nr:50S ribosomal protein L1 [Elusimicrobiota bacterium]